MGTTFIAGGVGFAPTAFSPIHPSLFPDTQQKYSVPALPYFETFENVYIPAATTGVGHWLYPSILLLKYSS